MQSFIEKDGNKFSAGPICAKSKEKKSVLFILKSATVQLVEAQFWFIIATSAKTPHVKKK